VIHFAQSSSTLAIAAALLLSCPGLAQNSEKRATPEDVGDTLRVALPADVDGFLGIVQRSAVAQMISSLIQPRLVASDFRGGELSFEPSLALGWRFSHSDTRLTFSLRKDVTWPDGHPITAEDVKFTMDLIGDPKVGSPRRSNLEKMDDDEPVTVVDDYTVRFNFKHAYNKTTMVAHAASVDIVPKHRLENVDRSALREHEFNRRKPFGHGPYKLEKWIPGSSITLVRNPDCKTQPVPYIKRIVFEVIPDYATRLNALENGEVDLIDSIQVKDVASVRSWPDVKVYTKGYRFLDYITWNMKHELFADRDVRRALTMAIDIERMIDTLLKAGDQVYGVQASSTITPEIKALRAGDRSFPPFREPARTVLPFAPDKSKQILADKGWKPGRDGILVKDGRRFEFELATNAGNPRRAEAVKMVSQDLAKLGIKVDVRTYGSVDFFDRLSRRNFEAALAGWSAALFVDPSNLWGSPTKSDPKPFNFSCYSDPLVDKLLAKGLHTANASVERECWLELQTLIYSDQPYTFLFWRSDSFACHKRFRGIVPNILTTYYKLPTWWVPKAEHKFKS